MYFFDNYVLAINKNENIASAEVNCLCPALDWRVERMRGCSNNLLTIDEYMNQLVSLVDVGFYDFLQRDFSGFLVPRPDIVTGFYRFNGFCTFRCQNHCSSNEAKIRIIRSYT